MPRPRILRSPRCKPRNQINNSPDETSRKIITIDDSDEPDCEIVKIEDTDDESLPAKFLKAPLKMFQVSGESRSQYGTAAPPIPSMLSLQLHPEKSSRMSGDARTNVCQAQNIMMVVPVSSTHSQTFNPKLCTFERIDNPEEIPKIRQIVASRRKSRKVEESRKKILQAIFVHNSAENRRNSCENQNSDATNEITGVSRKLEVAAVVHTEEDDFQDADSSVVEICSNESTEIVDYFEKAMENREEDILQPTQSEVNASGSHRDQSLLEKYFKSLNSMENPKTPVFGGKKVNEKKRIFIKRKSMTTEPEITIGNIDLSEGERETNLVRKRSADGAVSIEKSKRSICPTTKNTNGVRSTIPASEIMIDEVNLRKSEKVANMVPNIPADGAVPVEKSKRSIFPTSENTNGANSTTPTLVITIDKLNLRKSEKAANLVRRKPSDGTDSIVKRRKSIFPTTGNVGDVDDSKNHANLSPFIASSSRIVEETDSRVTATTVKNYKAENPWRVQCIACRKNFADRTDLHRHATLAHPHVQILFCDLCSESFLTVDDLQAHRAEICNSEIAEIFETIVIDDEREDSPQPTKSPKSPESDQTRENSKTEEKINVPRKRGRPRRFRESSIAKNSETKEKINVPRRCGRPRKIRESSIAKKSARYKYVEEEVMNHAAIASRKQLGKAEIKKLIVPLARLEGATLEKYLGKWAARQNRRNSMNKTNNTVVGRDVLTRKKSSLRVETPLDGSKTLKFRPRKRLADDDSDANRVIGIKRNVFTPRERPIRKLTSRSSAASVVSLKIRSSKSDTRKNVNWSKNVEKSAGRYTKPESSDFLYEKSDAESANDTALEEFDPEQFEEVANSSSKDCAEFVEKYEQKNVKTTKKSTTRRTYRPSKRKSATAIKRQSEATTYELCLMCRELFALMKQLAAQFEGNRAKRISVKCPFCHLYFISMFYLKKHVASYHLHCQSKIPCKLATTLLIARSLCADAALDCKTELTFAMECQRCSTEFSDQKSLIDHIFTQHDAPSISYEDPVSASPQYVRDLPSSCFEMLEERAENPSKSVEDRPIVERSPGTFVSQSSGETDAKDSTKESVLICALCDANFAQRTDYVCHLRSEHNSMSSFITGMKSKRSANDPLEESFNSAEIPIAKELNANDQMTVDRDYLLKQLLSDDSEDAFEDAETWITGKERKFAKQEAAEDAKKFESSKCQICERQFERTQDLLIHCLEHGSNASEVAENKFKAPETEVNVLFADSPDDKWNNEGLVGFPPVALTAEEYGTKAAISEPIRVKDDIFASGNENDDFSLVYESTESPEYEHIDFLQRKMTSSSTKSLPSIEKSEKLTKNRSLDKTCSKPTEPRNEKLEVLKELLETEKVLANPDEANTKLPIECSKCNRKFPNQGSLNEHLFFLHDDRLKDKVLTDVVTAISRPSYENTQEWRCDKCSHTFKLLQNYSRHRYFMHGDHELVHICENCGKVLTTVTMVNVHICTDVASYNCRTCNETFATGMSLRLHNMYKHMETEGPHVCRPCDKKFLTNAMLKWHERFKHCFFRPYRPRKGSPVRMATPDKLSVKFEDTSDENEMDRRCDQEYVDMEYKFTARQATKASKRNLESTRIFEKVIPDEKCPSTKTRVSQITPSGGDRLVAYIDEREIFRCDLCRLYCLSKVALLTHKAKSHSNMAESCRICGKFYIKGKLLRHMIDRHINPCENYRGDRESIWDVGKNVDERDAEELIRILGTTRLISLCEYQRFSDSSTGGSAAVSCPSCAEEFDNCAAYKRHFFTRHDTMCALCNIEFKSGDKAAVHKSEDHGSADSYLWFAEKIVVALTAAANFSKVAEESFIEMISRDSDETSDVESLDAREEENSCFKEEIEGQDSKGDGDEGIRDEDATVEENVAKRDDGKLIIVVADEDIEKYGIGTKNPNIWGLAAKISSTSRDLTPKDVKVMLESYFER